MSDRGSGPAEAAIPLAPKSNARPDPNDPLDKASHLILDMVGQAASIAEANYQKAVEVSRSLSVQLRGAEDGYESLRQPRADTRRGQIVPRDGCIRSRWRLSRNSLPGKMIVLRSLCLHKPISETMGDRPSLALAHRQRSLNHRLTSRIVCPSSSHSFQAFGSKPARGHVMGKTKNGEASNGVNVP